MIIDIIICGLLIAILVVLFEFGKIVSYYGQIIHHAIPTISLSIHAFIQYLTDKLKQFLRYIKTLISFQKQKKINVSPTMIDELSIQLEMITGEA